MFRIKSIHLENILILAPPRGHELYRNTKWVSLNSLDELIGSMRNFGTLINQQAFKKYLCSLWKMKVLKISLGYFHVNVSYFNCYTKQSNKF